MLRNTCDWSKNFMCTFDGVPYGMWINFEEVKKDGKEKTLVEVLEVIEKVL